MTRGKTKLTSFPRDYILFFVIYLDFPLRRIERVFCCCSACGTMEDYKEGYLMVWANCLSPCNSIARLYFEDTCDVISVTMVHKNVH